jgi:hypothetical protein
VLELLNDAASAYLKLQDAQFYRLGGQKLVKKAAEALMPKSKVHLAILPDDKHEAPQRRQFAFVEKGRCELFVVSGEFEVEGCLSVKIGNDPLRAIDFEYSAFFPVTAARVECVNHPQHSLQASVVFVNKAEVSAIYFGDRSGAAKPAISLAT